MFPAPIEKASPGARIAYKVALPIALIVWLLPLIAIFLTSIRPGSDIAKGNVFGWPSSFELIANYSAVFEHHLLSRVNAIHDNHHEKQSSPAQAV